MYRDRQRQEWPNRRLDPLGGARGVWRRWAYDHLKESLYWWYESRGGWLTGSLSQRRVPRPPENKRLVQILAWGASYHPYGAPERL